MQTQIKASKLKLEKKTITRIMNKSVVSRENFLAQGPSFTILDEIPSLAEVCTTTVSWPI